MKKAQIALNMALPVSMNRLRVRRWINRHLAPGARVKAGDRRYRMAYRANLRRSKQGRLFRFNGFRRHSPCL